MPRGGARPGAGRPRKGAEVGSKAALAVAAKAPKAPKEPKTAAPGPDLPLQTASDDETSPLDYLLSIVRDPFADPKLRMQAASIAAPYVHARKGEGGKKDAKNEAAKQVAGRFSAAAPPKLVAAGGKKV